MSDTKFDVTLKGNKILPEKEVDKEPSHRKKKDGKSRSSKRSDHKHEYKGAILEAFSGWSRGKYCAVCGRIQEGRMFVGDKEFLKPEFSGSRPVGRYKSLSLEEIKEKYEDTPIFVLDRETWEHKRVD